MHFITVSVSKIAVFIESVYVERYKYAKMCEIYKQCVQIQSLQTIFLIE